MIFFFYYLTESRPENIDLTNNGLISPESLLYSKVNGVSSLGREEGRGDHRSILCWINVCRLGFYTEQRVVGTPGLVCGRKLENNFIKQMPGDGETDGCGLESMANLGCKQR